MQRQAIAMHVAWVWDTQAMAMHVAWVWDTQDIIILLTLIVSGEYSDNQLTTPFAHLRAF